MNRIETFGRKVVREAIKRTPLVAAVITAGAVVSACYPENAIIHDATAIPSAATGTPRPTTPEATPTAIKARVDLDVNVNVNVNGAPATTVTVKPEVAATAKPSSTKSLEQVTPPCPDADQIGIWAPNDKGEGETFEIDSTQSDSIVLANIWFPKRSGDKVVYQLILNGRRVQFINGSGTAWRYKPGCSMEEVQRQGLEHEKRREANGEIIHKVTVEELDALFPDLIHRLQGDSTLR